MSTPYLTIAIPTYNRINQLRNTLSKLLPQLTDRCYLLILDNCSEVPVEEAVCDLIGNLNNYKIIRNRVNIGGDPNIFKCFELCNTGWLWTLSDDDEVESNSIMTIFNTIERFTDALNINFYSPCELHKQRTSTLLFYGRKGLIDSIDTWGASIFISSNVYNMKLMKSYYESNTGVYSRASQWLMLFYNAEDNYIVRSCDVIVKNVYTSSKYTSVNLSVVNGFISILDMPLDKKMRKDLTKKILTIDDGWISFQSLIKLLLIEYKRDSNNNDFIYHMRNYYYRLYRYGKVKNRIYYYIFLVLMNISPNASFVFLRKVMLLLGKKDIFEYTKV